MKKETKMIQSDTAQAGLGLRSPGQRNDAAADADRPSIHGKMLGKALALFADLGRRDAPMSIPETCLTCAFREGSMPNQSAGTGMAALNCVLGIDRDRFACHHGMKDSEPQRICAGYVAALLAPFSLVREILLAFDEELALIENRPDDVRAAFDAWLDLADPERRMDVYQAAREYAKSELAEVKRIPLTPDFSAAKAAAVSR